MSRLMGAISIERIETRVEASSSDIHVVIHAAISWTPDSVLYVWCFNGNINDLQYFQCHTKSLSTTEIQTGLPFDMCSISDVWENIGSQSKS